MLLKGPTLHLISNLLLSKFPKGYQVAGFGVSGALLVPAIVLAGLKSERMCNGLIIRDKRKNYGRRLQIEGDFSAKPVVIVDDIVNSGRTLFEAVSILREHGLRTKAVAAIINFEKSVVHEWLEDESISFEYLTTLRELRSEIPELRRNG